MSATQVLDRLRKEHGAIAAEVGAIASEVGRLGASEGQAAATIGAIASRLRSLHAAFSDHRRKEEEGLFPAVIRALSQVTPRPGLIVAFFEGEAEEDVGAHEKIECGMQRIEALLESARGEQRGGTDVIARLREACGVTFGLLERHAEKEDGLVFPMVMRMLTDAQLEAVHRRLQELPSGTGRDQGDKS